MDAPVVLAVDGNSLVHRSFHGQARTGQPGWAVRGLLSQLVAAVDRIRPTVVVVGFDDTERSQRREQWPGYKAHRPEKLETLVEQLAQAVEVMRELGVAVVVPPGLEADDVLASAAAFAADVGATAVIATSDRDAFSLIDEHTAVLRIINGGVDASPLMTAQRLVSLLGVLPAQYCDYAALRGDPSDNLPGVRGIGPRTAARLLAEFGCAAAAFADLAGVRARLGAGVARCLAQPEARAVWEHNCQVMALRRDVALGLDLNAGAGVLPLAAKAVDGVFRALNLTWSASQAVQVLAWADELAPPPPAPQPMPSPWLHPTFDDAAGGWAARGSVPRHPPLRRPSEQLALF